MPNPRSTAPDPYVPTYHPGFGLGFGFFALPPLSFGCAPGEGAASVGDACVARRKGGEATVVNDGRLTPVSSGSTFTSTTTSIVRPTSTSGAVPRALQRPGKRKRVEERADGPDEGVELIEDRFGRRLTSEVHEVGDGLSGDVGDLGSAGQPENEADAGEHDELESVSSSLHGAVTSTLDDARTGVSERPALASSADRTRSQCLQSVPDMVPSTGRPKRTPRTSQIQRHDSVPAASRTQSKRSRGRLAASTATPTTVASQITQTANPPTSARLNAPVKRKRKGKCPTHSSQPPAPQFSAEPVTLVPHGLPPIHTTVDPYWLYLFFRFCSERHTMQDKREAGVPRDKLSEDETMRKSFVGNVYRELDRGSVRVREEVIGVGEQSVEEVCFRLFLYCGFHEYGTWTTLIDALGHVPRWSTFIAELPIYERALHIRSFIQRKTLYTSGFQLVPPTRYYGLKLPHYAATLRFVKSLMDSGLPHRLQSTRFAVDASHLLQSFPTLGPFLSLGILSYLNGSAGFKWFWRDFASCGPGARGYMQKIFGKQAINSVAAEEAGLRWLRENQWVIWKRLGVDPPFASGIKGIRPGMRCVDIENALCWCHRYVVDYTKNGWKSLADIPLPARTAVGRQRVKREPGEELSGIVDEDGNYNDGGGHGDSHGDKDGELEADEPAWCERKEDVGGISKAVQKGDYDEVKERLPPTEEGEEVYEVEKIVCRKGQRGGKDGLFRVRWKGWAPEDDTWERASSLRKGADEVSADELKRGLELGRLALAAERQWRSHALCLIANEQALQEWLDWEDAVWGSIERVKDELPWTRPEGLEDGVKEEQRDDAASEEQALETEIDMDPDPESERRRARGRNVRASRHTTATVTQRSGTLPSNAEGLGRRSPCEARASEPRPWRPIHENEHTDTPGATASTTTPASVAVVTPCCECG